MELKNIINLKNKIFCYVIITNKSARRILKQELKINKNDKYYISDEQK